MNACEGAEDVNEHSYSNRSIHRSIFESDFRKIR